MALTLGTAGAGAELVVAPGATLTTNRAITANAGGTFTNAGTVVLRGRGGNVKRGNGTVTNNGVIQTAPGTSNTTMSSVLELNGTGTVKAGNFTTPIILLTGAALNQNLVLDFTSAQDFALFDGPQSFTNGVNTGKTITLNNSFVTLVLGANTVNTGATIINKGTIETATTSTVALKNIFAEMNADKGKVDSTGDIIDIGSEDFEVPAKVELTLNGSGTNFGTTVKNLIVEGTLINANSAALAPLGNVTVNGILDLATGGLTVAATKTLTLSSSASFGDSAATGTITVTDIGAVTIDGKIGYSIDGLTAGEYGTALSAIQATSDALTDQFNVKTADLPRIFDHTNTNGPVMIIGSVDVSDTGGAGGPTRVVRSTDMGPDDNLSIRIPSNITLDATISTTEPTNNTAGPAGTYVLGVTSDYLTLEDSAYSGGGTPSYGILSYNSYKIQYKTDDLVSPNVEKEFAIGVRSKS
jgi:hypothetical protein